MVFSEASGTNRDGLTFPKAFSSEVGLTRGFFPLKVMILKFCLKEKWSFNTTGTLLNAISKVQEIMIFDGFR